MIFALAQILVQSLRGTECTQNPWDGSHLFSSERIFLWLSVMHRQVGVENEVGEKQLAMESDCEGF